MRLVERPLAVFLEDLASSAPTPGGGSASALGAAAGAALVAMVARLSEQQAAERSAALRDRAEDLRRTLTGLIETDAAAFDAVLAAYRLPRGTDDEKSLRRGAVQAALTRAADVPLQVAAGGLAVLQSAMDLVDSANPNAVSDLGAAAALAAAGVEGARLNVLINARSITDAAVAARLRGEAERLAGTARTLGEGVLAAVERRIDG
jgi:formiminotetrahydrofolate cyclodeaminase